jgi:hypothetical protein
MLPERLVLHQFELANLAIERHWTPMTMAWPVNLTQAFDRNHPAASLGGKLTLAHGGVRRIVSEGNETDSSKRMTETYRPKISRKTL